MIPMIETKRLKLRGHEARDFPDSAAMWADPEVVRYIGTPSNRQQAWSRFLVYLGHWSAMGFGYWAVEEKITGRFIGEIGFSDFKRELMPPLEGIPEVGWVLVPDAQGKGYATEGVLAALEWSASHFGSRKISCLIDAKNAPSVRVAERCGFQQSHSARYLEKNTEVYFKDLLGKSHDHSESHDE
ncbi:MAG: GNAT family N-acetyltransferase [Cryobacterium sp.]|nr:GNAT family N-acetyltransferase [Oligoflexia bacterium]